MGQDSIDSHAASYKKLLSVEGIFEEEDNVGLLTRTKLASKAPSAPLYEGKKESRLPLKASNKVG